ncbi:MAG: amidohydrolase family protein [Candidatus Methanomethylicia archaeon]
MIIDFHIHSAYRENIVREMNRAGVDIGVVVTIDADPNDIYSKEAKAKVRSRFSNSQNIFYSLGSRFIRGLGRQTPIEDWIRNFMYEAALIYPGIAISNEELGRFVSLNPERLIGFGSVNPNKSISYVEEKLKEIKNHGLRGVKLIPTIQFFNPSENRNISKIFEFCERNRLIILYHTGCDPGPFEIPELSEDANPKYLHKVLDIYSNVKLVLAHIGSYSAIRPGIWFNEALNLMRKYDNVYADTSAVTDILYNEKMIKKIRETVGFERIIFGSDYPIVDGRNILTEVENIKRSVLKEYEKEQVLGLNAQSLLKQ